MSRRYQNRRETKGHGVLGFLATLIIILIAFAVVLFFFTGNDMKGLKGQVYSFFYPQKYTAEVQSSAREFNVDEALIYSVIRNESGFRPEVESHAGAIGLMQLMPATFDWLQEKLDGSVKYDTSQLTDPAINIRYGTYFLSILLERYGSDIRTVAAAYNAGTTTVDGWLADTAYSANGTTLTKIPYSETEHYAEKVEKTYEMYKKLYYGLK